MAIRIRQHVSSLVVENKGVSENGGWGCRLYVSLMRVLRGILSYGNNVKRLDTGRETVRYAIYPEGERELDVGKNDGGVRVLGKSVKDRESFDTM